MRFLPLVWAAIWRHRAESLLTIFALSVAFTLFGSMLALNTAYESAIRDARMDRLFVTRRFDGPASLPLGYRGQLSRIPGVTAVGGQIWFGGRERDLQHAITVMFVDEGMRAAWPELPLSQADWRALDAMPSGIFLTRKAAARRDVRTGGIVTLNTVVPGSRADGGTTWYFTVLGIVPDPPGWGQWNPDLIIGNLRYWEQTSDLQERGGVNALRVAIDRPEHARAVCRTIEARFTNASPALSCAPARENAQLLADANINMRKISVGIAAAGLFMILFLSANGMAESVRERQWEFGVLKTIGFSHAALGVVVILESAIPTLLAAVLGATVATVVDAIVAHLALTGVINLPDIRPSSAAFGWALLVALLVALVSSVSPLGRLRRMQVGAVVAGR
ncbi:MAG TPA: ABC transporter permease [Steroidobacteraceae bacterium]|nr:ABC transporter permease [Steroidobacteraceae bacterium]